MNTIASIAAAPFAALASGVVATGSAVTLGVSMLFSRVRGWGVYMNRTRIDYRSEVGDPSTNSVVGAVVGWIARNFPEAPVRIIREDDPEAKPIVRSAAGPGRMLRLLERPNPYYSGVLQWMATLVDFMIGNAYWLKVRSANGSVVALWWVPATLIEPAWPENDPTVFISHYEYRVDGIIYIVKPKDIVHFRNGIDPQNPRKGLSRLGSLFREIFTDDEAANFTASLLRNLGVPGVIISPSNTSPGGRVDGETVKKAFMEKFGGDKRGEPMVLTAPTDVKVLSFNPTEMDLKSIRRVPEERISAVLGIPAGVAGLGAGLDRNTFSNYAEAIKAAITQGVVPLHRLIAAELEVQLLPEFADTEATPFDVYFDIMEIAGMQEALGEIWKRNESAAARGLITRADFKRAAKLRVTPADDVYVMPNNFTVTPIDEAGGNQSPRLALVPDDGRPAEPAAVEVRCAGTRKNGKPCNALLAEQATAPYRFTCAKSDCGAETVAA